MATTIKLWLAWCYSVVITSSFAQDSTFDNQTIQVPVGEAVNITSSGFPTYCCDSQTFLITAQQPHIRLTFTDIDLSGGSKLIIYDGGNSSSMPFAEQSVFRDGVWSRPVIVSKGTNLFITLEPGKRKEKQNIGFRAVARIATDLSWTVDRPYTNCPPAHDAMQSGKVRLSRLPTTRLDSEFHMMFDCVWQIMTPKNMPDLKVFVRINSINLIDGHIEVRDGPSSVSMLAGSASTSTAPTASQQMEALDESNAFTTSTTSTSSQRAGLYISVVKPVTEGTLFFEYGVYQHTDVPGPKCTLKMDKTSYNGFRCRSTAWCIPAEHKCDGIRNCEDYSDEDEKYCPTTDTEDTSPRPTIIGVTLTTSCRDTTCLDGTCSSPQQDCPEDCRISQTWCHNIRQCRTAYQYGGNSLDVCGEQQDDCPRHHKRCEDGSCVWLWNDCPVTSNCFLHERECRSGTCVNRLYDDCPEDCSSRQKYCSTPKECVASSARCPGEACPSYKPNQCGTSNHCYYDYERCDGMSNCPHYEDEHDCDTSHDDGDSSGMSFLYILFIGAAVILPIILIKCLMKKKTPEQSNTEMQNLNATTTTSSSTRPTTTAPAQSTTSRVTRPTTTNSASAPSQPLLSGSNATAGGGAASGEGGADAPPSYDEAVAGNAYAVPDTPNDDALPSYESLSKTQPTVFVEASMDDDDGGGGEGASTAANNTVDV